MENARRREKESCLREWKKLFIMRIFRWLAYNIFQCVCEWKKKNDDDETVKNFATRALSEENYMTYTQQAWKSIEQPVGSQCCFLQQHKTTIEMWQTQSRRYNNNEIISSSILLFTIFCIIIIMMIFCHTICYCFMESRQAGIWMLTVEGSKGRTWHAARQKATDQS